MKSKTSIMLLVAVALGLVTAKVGWDIISRSHPTADGVKTIKLLVAKHDLDPGLQIEASDVEPAVWPAETAPKNAFKDVKDVVGRTVTSGVVANAPVLEG